MSDNKVFHLGVNQADLTAQRLLSFQAIQLVLKKLLILWMSLRFLLVLVNTLFTVQN